MANENSLDEIKIYWHNASEVVLDTAIRDIKDYPPQIQKIIEGEVVLRKLNKTEQYINEEKESTMFRFRRQIKIAGLLLLMIIIFTLVMGLCTELEMPYRAYGKTLVSIVFILIFRYAVWKN